MRTPGEIASNKLAAITFMKRVNAYEKCARNNYLVENDETAINCDGLSHRVYS